MNKHYAISRLVAIAAMIALALVSGTAEADSSITISVANAPTDRNYKLLIDGNEVKQALPHGFTYSVYPTQVCVQVTGVGVYFPSATYDGVTVYPDTTGSLLVMPPPSGDGNLTLNLTTEALWVSPYGEDAEFGLGYGSEESPYKTPHFAATKAKEGVETMIFCEAGLYEEGASASQKGVASRIYDYGKKLHFVGAGAGKSILKGKLSTATNGRGSGAIRCATFTGGGTIRNFTVTDGSVTGTSGTGDGAIGGAGYGVNFVDCVITNCSAVHGTAVNAGSLWRCRICTMAAQDAELMYGTVSAYFCLFRSNRVPSDGSARNVYQSTLYPGYYSATYPSAIFGKQSQYYNCVAKVGGPVTDTKDFGNKASGCCWFWETLPVMATANALTLADHQNADPQFVDYANGDCRLSPSSPAHGCGQLNAAYYKWMGGDINWKRLIFVDGKPTAGAFHDYVMGIDASFASPHGELEPNRFIELQPGESATVALGDHTRPVAGLSVNGKVLKGQMSYTYTAPSKAVPFLTNRVEIVFTPDWYVNPMMPDDEGDGFTPATAKRTLNAMMASANVIEGDVVHAAEGVYNEGFAVKGTSTARSRVLVKAGVTLMADGDRAKTIIRGAASPSPTLGSCGPNATRCAYVSAGATLKGFTLTGGYTDGNASETEPNLGGGVFAEEGAIVEDCVIRDCHAYAGNTVAGGTYYRCQIGDLESGSIKDIPLCPVGGMFSCALLVNGNVQISYPFINSLCRTDSGDALFANSAAMRPVTNSIFRCAINYSAATTSVFLQPPISGNIVCTGFAGNTTYIRTNRFTERTNDAIDGVYPTINGLLTFAGTRDNIFADKGVEIEDEKFMEGDLFGVSRSLNGKIDLGPCEFDWRQDYAAALGRDVTCEAASKDVTLDGSQLKLSNGDTLVFKRKEAYLNSDGIIHFPFEISNGMITVRVNGEAVASFGANDEYKFKYEAGFDDVVEFEFSGSDDAYAVMSPTVMKCGFAVSLR